MIIGSMLGRKKGSPMLHACYKAVHHTHKPPERFDKYHETSSRLNMQACFPVREKRRVIQHKYTLYH